MKRVQIASMIDHTLLAPTASTKEISKLCGEAKEYSFASVCVNPVNVALAASELEGSPVKVCTVVGFPLGATSTKSKAFEAVTAISEGADEVDMVIDIAAAIEGRFSNVQTDIQEVVDACREEGKRRGKDITVKVILETCFLDDEAVIDCCKCSVKAGADFVKTSTGFANPKDSDGKPLPNGATVHHVKLMRETVGSSCGVKASGGVRSASFAADLVKAGANRIGASNGVQIVKDWNEDEKIPGWDS